MLDHNHGKEKIMAHWEKTADEIFKNRLVIGLSRDEAQRLILRLNEALMDNPEKDEVFQTKVSGFETSVGEPPMVLIIGVEVSK